MWALDVGNLFEEADHAFNESLGIGTRLNLAHVQHVVCRPPAIP